MKVQFIGKDIQAGEMVAKLQAVIAETLAKFAEDTESEVAVTAQGIVEAEFTIKFNVDGEELPQIMTVEHHPGSPEMFTWIVDMDKESTITNEESSMFDDFTVATAKGKEFNFKEVESVYSIIDLEEIPELTETYTDMSKKVYEHKDGYRVVQVRQHKKLIQEYRLIPAEVAENA